MQLYFSFARSFSEIACTRAYRWLLGTIAVCVCADARFMASLSPSSVLWLDALVMLEPVTWPLA